MTARWLALAFFLIANALLIASQIVFRRAIAVANANGQSSDAISTDWVMGRYFEIRERLRRVEESAGLLTVSDLLLGTGIAGYVVCVLYVAAGS